MKRAVLLQECTVMAFGEGLYFRILQEGQSVIINLISHLMKEKPGIFLKYITGYIQTFRPHQFALRHIAYGQTYAFICTKTQDVFF